MPWSGGSFSRTNGVHTGSTLWVQDRDAGTKILATRHDTHDQDLAGGINSTINKDGSNAATGNLDLGSNRLTAVADGTAKTDAATVNQIQSNAPAFQATATGTATAIAIALSPAITAYAAGQEITFKAASASTGAATLNVNGLGAKTLKKKNDQDIAANDVESGAIVTAVYDGTNFQVTSQLGTSDLMSFTLTGDSGTNQTINDGNTLDVAGGTGIDTVVGATDTVTVAVDSSVALVSAQNTWTKGQAGATQSGTGLTLDYDTYQNFIITLGNGSNSLANPTTENAGQAGVIVFVQPSSSTAATLSLGTDYETAAAGGITLSSANNDYDIVPYFVKASGSILLGTPQLNFG